MRLDNYIKEGKWNPYDDPPEWVKIKPADLKKMNHIIVSCSDYFREFGALAKKGQFLWRGVGHFKGPIEKRKPLKDRRPMDTQKEVQRIVDDLFEKKLGWRPRQQGVFTGNNNTASCYGTRVCIFIPTNGYRYVYSTSYKYHDMYTAFGSSYNDSFMGSESEYEDDWHDMYGPDADNPKGRWVSKTWPKQFKYTYDMEDSLEDKGYDITTDDYKVKEFYNYDTNKKVIFKWVTPEKVIPKKEFVKKQLEKDEKRASAPVIVKAKKYIATCKTTGVSKYINKGMEIMFKCDYYYLITEEWENMLPRLYKGYELK